MNIRELKEILKDLPDDMPVFVKDSEYGPEECTDNEFREIGTWDHRGQRNGTIKVLILG